VWRAIRTGDYTDAFKQWTEAAQQGDVDAQYNLGCLYVRGEGVPQNKASAADWLQRAADQGDVDAATWLLFANPITDDRRKEFFSRKLKPSDRFRLTFAVQGAAAHMAANSELKRHNSSTSGSASAATPARAASIRKAPTTKRDTLFPIEGQCRNLHEGTNPARRLGGLRGPVRTADAGSARQRSIDTCMFVAHMLASRWSFGDRLWICG
jgi:Sel1 repeat